MSSFGAGLEPGMWVWIKPREPPYHDPFIAGEIRAVSAAEIKIDIIMGDLCKDCAEEYKQTGIKSPVTLKADSPYVIEPMADNSLPPGVENMIELGDLHEAALLHNIRMRFREKNIYTYTGDILICVNPYTDLGFITPAYMEMYKGKPMGELPPHPFAVGDQVYRAMRNAVVNGLTEEGQKLNQSVVISGESGAGKTVTTGHILQYLTFVTGKQSEVGDQINCSGELLESFGNAKTMRNHNSSRFGKFVEVLFDDDGYILGAEINHYLLEKSRIVTQSEGERNYHVFYQLFAATTPEERMSKWRLTEKPQDYFYLAQSSVTFLPEVDDVEMYNGTIKGMETLHFPPEVVETVFKICAAVLHIGNIEFDLKDHDKPGEGCTILNPEEVEATSFLLDVPPAELERCLLQRKVMQTYSVFSPPEAKANRDSLSKNIYNAMFDWICYTINETVSTNVEAAAFIGVLDIFGFEHFTNKVRPLGKKLGDPGTVLLPNNHFEQLCINFANEQLQNFFNDNIFKQEMRLYESERLDTDNIDFQNNDLCIKLIADQLIKTLKDCSKEKPPMTWEDFHKNLMDKHKPRGTKNWTPDPNKEIDHRKKTSEFLDRVPMDRKYNTDQTDFIIHHYAGPVQYTAGSHDPDAPASFVEKNKDKLSPDLTELIEESANPLIASLFGYAETGGSKAPNVADVFKASLSSLIGKLQMTNALFVRTIKPNHMKKKVPCFEDKMVLEQLRSAGMLETIKVRKMGYPRNRVPLQFVEHYKILVHAEEIMDMSSADAAQYILERFCVFSDEWIADNGKPFQIGVTKIFMKDTAFAVLEEAREKRLAEIKAEKDRAAVVFQCMWYARVMAEELPKLIEREKEMRAWNEEKRRRMQETGLSAEEVEALMREERAAKLEADFQALVASIVPPAEAAVAKAVADIPSVTSAINALRDDGEEPHWTDAEVNGFNARTAALKSAATELQGKLADLKAAYSARKEYEHEYDKEIGPAVLKAASDLLSSVQSEAVAVTDEAEERGRAIQKEKMRKEAERLRLLEEARLAEIARIEAERKAKEEAIRLENERVERERRAKMEAKQEALRAEVENKRRKREQAEKEHEEWIARRREAAQARRAEEEKREALEKEEADFEARIQREHAMELEKEEQAEAARREKMANNKKILDSARTTCLAGTRVKYGKHYATVRYVGELPFFGSDIFVGIECDDHMGDTCGNNGECMGVKLFECVPGHGLFVMGEMLHVIDESPYARPIRLDQLVDVKGMLGWVRYVGKLDFESGDWVGVELQEPLGKHDGTIKGTTYFRCKPNHGMFVRTTTADPVMLWTPRLVEKARQKFIIDHDLDVYLDTADDFDDMDIQALRMEELELTVKQRFGEEATLDSVLGPVHDEGDIVITTQLQPQSPSGTLV